MTTLPLTLWMGSTTTATARLFSASKLWGVQQRCSGFRIHGLGPPRRQLHAASVPNIACLGCTAGTVPGHGMPHTLLTVLC